MWIVVDKGQTFIGNEQHWGDCFFSNVTVENIITFCEMQGSEVRIIQTLKDWLPDDFLIEYSDTRAASLLDVEVIWEHTIADDGKYVRWPGRHKNVLSWVELKNGLAVGWNENPARGWTFPVMKLKRTS